MSDRRPILLGHAQSLPDAHAGDVCKLRGVDGLWVPYEHVEDDQFRFARFPKLDATRTFALGLVESVEHGALEPVAREFWVHLLRLPLPKK